MDKLKSVKVKSKQRKNIIFSKENKSIEHTSGSKCSEPKYTDPPIFHPQPGNTKTEPQ